MSDLLPQTTAPSTTAHSVNPLIRQLLDQVDKLEVDIALASTPQCKSDMPVEASLIRQGIVSERQIATTFANHYLLPLFDPPQDAKLPIDPSVGQSLAKHFCLKHVIAPLTDDGSTIEVALFAPDSFLLADQIRAQTGRQMRSLFAPLSVICRVQDELYSGVSSEKIWKNQESVVPAASNDTKREVASSTAKVERYLRRVFRAAIRHEADRIHIERYENASRVRFFVGGKIVEITPPDNSMANGVISKLKMLGNMDVRQMALPQDGEIRLAFGQRSLKAKVSICPTIFGENVMMSIGDV